MLKELFRRKPQEPKPNPIIDLGSVKLEIDMANLSPLFTNYLHPNKFSLETAAKHGCKPLTLEQVLEQIDPALHKNLVLFDATPHTSMPGGNRFRVVENENGERELLVTSTFGAFDIRGPLPFTPPEDCAMFTGAALMVYTKPNGELVTLDEVVKFYRESRNYIPVTHKEFSLRADIIMWSDAEGKLTSHSNDGVQLPFPTAS